MSPQARKLLITMVIAVVAGGLLSIMFFTPKVPPPAIPAADSVDPDVGETDPASDADEATDAGEATDVGNADPDSTQTPAPVEDAAADQAMPGPVADSELAGLHATPSPRGRAGTDVPAQSAGSLDPNTGDKMLVEYSVIGGGIERITFSEHWLTAKTRQEAKRHYVALAKNAAVVPPLPDGEMRYVIMESQAFNWTSPSTGQVNTTMVPVFAAHSIVVGGQTINLANAESFSEVGVGEFESVIVDEAGTPVLTIRRRFTLGGNYDLTLEQRFTNHLERPLSIKWIQYGPGDLFVDRARYIDRRRFRTGFLLSPTQDPSRSFVQLNNDMLVERRQVQKNYEKSLNGGLTPQEVIDLISFWPNSESIKNSYELSSFSSTNRYFGLAVHPVLDAQGGGNRFLSDVVDEIRFTCIDTNASSPAPSIFTYLYSPALTVPAGETLPLDLGIYAGPLDRHVLGEDIRYKNLNLQGLILYQISSFCAFCTFQWLAHWLLTFLSFAHAISFDWGIAIILLVVLVRGMLHPITKKSQINMQRFGKKMQLLKPELDKLQKKYGDDPNRMKQEQMRLWKEHNINPLQMLGCLPMFLQTPIWIALYAMLYLAFDIRQEPAFYGLFQQLWGWPFLADLSAADHFFGEFETPTKFLLWNLTGINFLPILMGVIFFFQQKYMSPPPSPTMTKEQISQQRIMKVMMVVMFPLMLYSAPSGLTLYILTSSTIGIIESKYVRAHIKDMDLDPPKPDRATPNAGPGKKKPKDAQGRAFSDAIERAKAKGKGAPKKFKRRK